jgi:hypothetical protein
MCGVWRGYDVAGVGGGKFALQLVLHQRVAPLYWRSDTHTHIRVASTWHTLLTSHVSLRLARRPSATIGRTTMKMTVNAGRQDCAETDAVED